MRPQADRLLVANSSRAFSLHQACYELFSPRCSMPRRRTQPLRPDLPPPRRHVPRENVPNHAVPTCALPHRSLAEKRSVPASPPGHHRSLLTAGLGVLIVMRAVRPAYPTHQAGPARAAGEPEPPPPSSLGTTRVSPARGGPRCTGFSNAQGALVPRPPTATAHSRPRTTSAQGPLACASARSARTQPTRRTSETSADVDSRRAKEPTRSDDITMG